MPIVSQEQYQTMQAVRHGWKPTGSAKGLTKAVADEMVEKTHTPYEQLPKRKVRDAYRRMKK